MPFPPSENNCYPTFRGRRVTSKELRAFLRSVDTWALSFDVRAAGRWADLQLLDPWTIIRIDALLCMRYENLFTKKGERKRVDPSNRIKPLHDGLMRALGHDDCRFYAGRTKPVLLSSGSECVHLKLTSEKIQTLQAEVQSGSWS